MSDAYTSVRIELPRDLDLLTRFYNELMKPNFPVENELEPLDVWIAMLEKNNIPGCLQQRMCTSEIQDESYTRQRDAADQPTAPITQQVIQPQQAHHHVHAPHHSIHLKKSSTTQSLCTFNISLCFSTSDTERKTIMGGVVYEYYHPSNASLITYLVIHSSGRGQGTGLYLAIRAWKDLLALARTNGHPSGPGVILCEVNDPAKIKEEEDAFSPVERIRTFQTMGVRCMEKFEYIQPCIDDSGEKGRGMMLAVVVGPMNERDEETGRVYVPSKIIRDFLHDFYREQQVPNFEQDIDFMSMMKSLEGRDRIYLCDFDLSRFPRKVKREAVIVKAPSSIPIHVIVIGAGIAGLTCARDLQRMGFTVTVLEARQRIGGRVHTSRSFDTRIDIGAAWIHGPDGNPLMDFIKTTMPDVQMHKNDQQSIQIYDEDGPVPENLIFEGYMRYLALLDALKTELANSTKHHLYPKHISLQDALHIFYQQSEQFKYADRKEKLVMNYMFSQAESLQNADSRWLAARDYDHGEEYEGGDHLLLAGFQNVAVALSTGLDIKLDTQVTKIEYVDDGKGAAGPVDNDVSVTPKKNGVRVHVSKGDVLTCEAVVITVPVGVLHANTITYHPPLPSWKQHSINAMGMGLFNKVVLRFPNMFWSAGIDYVGYNLAMDKNESDDSLDTIHRRRYNIWFVNLQPAVKEPILVAMLSAELAVTLEKMKDTEIVAAVMARVRRMYGPSIPAPIDTVITRWGADPYSRGSYSYLKHGAVLDDITRIGTPLANQLFWAGEHTSMERFGYADGAYVSGRREAKRLYDMYQHLDTTSSKPIQSKL